MGHKHKEVQYYEGGLRGLFDTHAHLYDDRLDPEQVLEHARLAGVDKILVPADNISTSRSAVEFAGRYSSDIKIWAAAGVHPHEASSYDAKAEEDLKSLLDNREQNRIRALGEIGLDYYYDLSPRDVQREVFKKQLLIAKEADIPFILHERDATGDCIEILRDFYKRGILRKNPGVCHCCGMSVESAEILIKMGFYIGFDGPLTYKNNRRGVDLCKACPEDRIVVETDSPYLTPEPNRGKTNEPCFVPFVIERLAMERGRDVADMARITSENGMALYEL